MKINRRELLTIGVAGGAAAAALPFSAFGQPSADNPKYAKLDAVLDRPTFKRELFADPVIIESVELLRYGRSFLCRVRSKDGAEGVSVAHDSMNVLYPLFVK
ncbi:MAG: mandelate racemase/muconate lactonizing enzyme family protein, partial [Deltaproteobacteria bacterium]|nr:mandelate racemase/muconate lactonizing enzyme family protein [Deltaproteobacteria bacterium]